MSLTRNRRQLQTVSAGLAFLVAAASAFSLHAQTLRFQRPSQSQQSQREQQVNKNFRSVESEQAVQTTARRISKQQPKAKMSQAPRLAATKASSRKSSQITLPKEVAQSLREMQRDDRVVTTAVRTAQHVPDLAESKSEEIPAPATESGESELMMPGEEYIIDGEYMDESYIGEEYGMGCPSCGGYPGGCGCGVEVGCGCAEPGCGAGVGCGSCVGAPGPDYWCFPVCLPRFKDLSFWLGTHGFAGPRDFYDEDGDSGNTSNSNFGFHTGINASGRAPFIGLLFPQLSYQIGYQAVGSRYYGTIDDAEDRSQEFATVGLFRRVECSGLQFGFVWDVLSDELYARETLQQIRYEVSLKSPRGREFGIWGASSANTQQILGVPYETVDQFSFFYRWNFGRSSSARTWIGFTDAEDGIFGAEFITPLTDRWSVQSGFNYLFPDQDAGPAGVREEAWNIGINLVWHLGRTAQRCARSPHRPMFSVADNGWMFVDIAR